MVPQELAEQLRAGVKTLKQGQEKFLQIYKQLCLHYGGPQWHQKDVETVFYNVRREIIPLMEQAGMDRNSVQALCAWAAKLAVEQQPAAH
jgi:hypothetical protein